MMKSCLFLFCIICILVPRPVQSQHLVDYGVRFLSHDVTKDERTSIVFPELPVASKGFSIAFHMRLMGNKEKYGYIFRLALNETESIDLICNSHSTSSRNLALVSGDKPDNIVVDLAKLPGFKKENWIELAAAFDFRKHHVTLTVNGQQYTDTLIFSRLDNIRLFFGANDYGQFSTTDVPPMEVRDIKVFNSQHQLLRHWELRQHNGNTAYDRTVSQPLEIRNPHWLIDEHIYWKKKAVIQTALLRPQISFRPDSSAVIIATRDSLYAYQLSTAQLVARKYATGTIYPSPNNQLLYNQARQELWQYDPKKNRIARFNFSTFSWDNEDNKVKEPAFWHHNKIISPVDSSVILFGGYGNFTYKNLVQRFDPLTGKWDTLPTTGNIKPRYLSSAGTGKKPTDLLIFGGYGNASGKQELSPEKLYDLYKLDLSNFTFTKLWENKGKDENFVTANSLHYEPYDSSFYVLCYPIHKYASTLYLRKFSLGSPENTIIGDSIPYFFQDTKSYADLFYSPHTGELVAVTSYPVGDSLTEVTVYTIAYPALSQQDALQVVPSFTAEKDNRWLLLLLPLLAILAYFTFRRKKATVTPKPAPPPVVEEQAIADTYQPAPVLPIGDPVLPATSGASSISLLGGFQVIDKNGVNISAAFTPALKQLLVLLALYTVKTGKGISSVQLRNLLWPDKSEESARNNRGVSIKKLRTLLEQVGNVFINNEGNHWLLTFEPSVHSDYFQVQPLITDALRQQSMDHTELIRIASKGSLLPDLDYEWLDSFKSDYASRIIDAMLLLTQKPEIRQSPSILIAICDIIFMQDPLNEHALLIKCRELYKLGKPKVAKNVYDSFVNEYSLTIGTAFHLRFEEVIA